MELTEKLLSELQRRLKIGNRRGVHLNAIPANSRYKFDLNRLSHIDKDLPNNFISELLTQQPLKFRISWKDNVPDLNSLFEEDQMQLVKITKAFENLINQTEAIESEKGINTFGLGFPILARRDKADNKLTVAPILIWSLRIKRTKEFNTWEILRNEEDPIYINEVLINHLQSDANVAIDQIPSEMLDDGLIERSELIEICINLIKTINTSVSDDIKQIFEKKLENIKSIGDKNHYEKLPLNFSNSVIDFGGLFSIFEVQKQNIINDFDELLKIEAQNISLEDLDGNSFQPISSIETDPSQQSILHSLETKRNILIQGPPGTGKSQTLTAVLINALENNKKTIVVCEKRTALEVLHKALIEKGLNDNAVLIRDIVKDRKTVVDSVRDRVNNLPNNRNHFTNNVLFNNTSKDDLNLILLKATTLIASINKKHKNIGKQYLSSKNWTNIVGQYLKENKSQNQSVKLNIDKERFEFSVQELNRYLDFIYKGHQAYIEFLPIQSASFINSQKFIGENPYLIKQNLNNDFDSYHLQIESIKKLLEANKTEYFDLRNADFSKQIKSITELISEIISYETKLEKLIQITKIGFANFRSLELNNQESNITNIISTIDAIFEKNKNNEDVKDQTKINSFGYKLLSVFSKSKKETIADHNSLRKYFEKLEVEIKNAKDFPNADFKESLVEKQNVLNFYKTELSGVKNYFNQKIESEFETFNLQLILNINESSNQFQSLNTEINNSHSSNEFQKHLLEIKSNFSTFQSELISHFEELKNNLTTHNDLNYTYSFAKSYIENKATFDEIFAKIETTKNDFDSKIQTEFEKLSLLKTSPSEMDLKNLPILQEKVNDLIKKINTDNWISEQLKFNDLNKFISEVESIISKKNKYFDSELDNFSIEFRWFQFFNSLNANDKAIVNELIGKENWRKTFLIHYLHSLLLSSANMDLPINDNEYIELDTTLKSVEREQLRYIKDFWYSKQIDKSRDFEQRNINLSVANLYNQRKSKNFNRLSLRQIVQSDSDLFTSFFPIVLTSPDVASNLFKGMNGYFDIVMFDEASQLRLEDNLPAILKGKQIIIAGDEHQMPPSNYFSKIFDGEVEEDEDIEEEAVVVDINNLLLSCESLLEFGVELNFEKQHLDFHYRSRHPYLIDFSNYAFYNQRLKPLPAKFDYVPIKYIQVNGTFTEHTNEAEAEIVLSIIDKNINRLPNGEYPTLGIATFNIAQRNLIKSKILERQKFTKFEEFNSKIQELEENGMFIKNLENIQGDERDVIILSTTYGVGKDRKFAQRFGPINHTKGYKLLNVIITRSKYKVYVCTSIPEHYIHNYKDELIREGSNNKRAVLYAYLAYSKAVSECNNELRVSILTTLAENTSNSVVINPDVLDKLESPFEEEVYQRLVDELGDKNLFPQVKVSEFRIDLVYDPKLVGVPKIAIECDGAKYHSSREAYLYDRHRQKILEEHGFVFHRIWSTNWWDNPSRETTKLVSFIKQIESSNHNLKSHSNTASAFTDDIEILEEYVLQTSFIDIEKDNEVIQAIEQTKPEPTKILTAQVKINSKVKVKYNNGKDMTVLIMDTEKDKNEVKNGVQNIYCKSPLAISLIGHTIGEIVKIGNLDNFVEILEIKN
jgi:superfamily I DNA and/or RNA helicase/very-short-patch-repair endonuclease/transcription elongation GreA/GreB family factor